MRLDELTVATFAPLVGERFRIDAPVGALELVLEQAQSVGTRPGGRDPFSLVFRGPPQPLLAQATYPLTHAAIGVLELFVVPIGQDADATRYEAIFT